MQSKSDDSLSNPSDSPKKDQTLIPTPDQDQEGDEEGKKAETEADADVDGTFDLLLHNILILWTENQALELLLNKSGKQHPRADAHNRSLRSTFQGRETEVKIMTEQVEVLQKVVNALEETKTRLEVELARFQPQIDRHLEIQGKHDEAAVAGDGRV